MSETEKQALRAQRYAESIVETLHEPVVVLTRDLAVNSANPAFYEQFRLTPDATLGRRIYDLGDGLWDIPSLRRLLEDVLPRDTSSYDYRLCHEFPGLGYMVMSLNARRLDDPDLIVLGIHDITERHASERAARETRQRLRRMVDVEGVSVLVFDDSGVLIDANDTFLRTFGYGRNEIEARTLTRQRLTPAEHLAASEEQARRLEESGCLGPYEKQYLHKDGSKIWVAIAGTTLGDGTSIKYCIDITDRKQVENALRESNRRKDEFLATLGHELRNPLAALRIGGLELLQQARKDPKLLDRLIPMMDRQIAHLSRIVDDLLDVARITHGKLELRRRSIDLGATILAAVEQTSALVSERRHDLSVDPLPPLPIDGDFDRLTQALVNLLTNAANYMDSGGTIKIRAATTNGEALVYVRDEGYGIPKERAEEVFELFGQLREHHVRTGGSGLGIGLALARQLIGLHGGSITVESDGFDRGSEFIVRLPMIGAAAESAIDDARAVPSRRRQILLVDDNADFADSLGMVLELQGHSVEVTYDGSAALRRLAHSRPEVVLLDLALPGIDGFEVARRIRTMPEGDQLRLIAISGWGQDAHRRRSRQAGFDAHLTKPVDTAELLALLASR